MFSETQFVSCRNVLIYFNKKLQDRALGLFHESLSHRGFLGLGSKESLDFSVWKKGFEPISKPDRLFKNMTALELHTLPKDFRRAARAVVIGASAGGVEALMPLLTGLPEGYPLPVVVVLHLPEDRQSLLAEVFGNRARVPVREAARRRR